MKPDRGAVRRLRSGMACAVLMLAVSAAVPAVHRKVAHPAQASRQAAAPASGAGPDAAAATDIGPWCERVASTVPGVSRPACVAAALVAGDGRSVQGVPLWARDVLPAGAPRFRVLFLSGIHGDELASVTLAFDWIARSSVGNADALKPLGTAVTMPANVAWRFVPLLNPDGLLHRPSTRVNAHGVDLNRNFPTADWARDAQPYWVNRTKRDPRRFPGAQPLSEPESRWLLEQIEQFRPDLIVSVHAPYGLLDFDGPPPVPARLGSLQLDPVGVYPGSLGNYGGLVKQVPVMTLELKNARQVPPAELAAMWFDLQRWIAERLARADAKSAARAPAPLPTKVPADDVRSARRRD